MEVLIEWHLTRKAEKTINPSKYKMKGNKIINSNYTDYDKSI